MAYVSGNDSSTCELVNVVTLHLNNQVLIRIIGVCVQVTRLNIDRLHPRQICPSLVSPFHVPYTSSPDASPLGREFSKFVMLQHNLVYEASADFLNSPVPRRYTGKLGLLKIHFQTLQDGTAWGSLPSFSILKGFKFFDNHIMIVSLIRNFAFH